MNKKKIAIYSSLIITGLLLGWLIFGGNNKENSSDNSNQTKNSSDVEIWTCSMHPQIKLPEPGDCPICGMDLIPLGKNANSNPLVLEMTDDAIKLMNIETTVIGNSTNNSEEGVRLSGKVISNETTTASIVSHIPGRIEKLYVAFTGEEIRKGQIIAKIYSPNLITAQKELIEAAKIKDVNPSLYEATVNKLKFWKITDKQIEEILRSKKVKESFGIYAEHSGIVSNKRVSVGDHLMEGGVLFDIQNLNKLWVEFDAYESDLQSIHVGDELTFTTPSVPNKKFVSKITFIDPVINPKTRSASVRVEINNTNLELKPEMFATGYIAKKTSASQQIFIPKSAVLWTGTRSVVYVKQKDVTVPSFEFREIEIGSASGDSYLVLSGLENGEEIVTKGAFVIDASAQLNNQSSMMNRKIAGAEIKTDKKTPDYQSETPKEFKNQLSVVVDAYFILKDNLISSDVKKSNESALKLVDALKKTDMSLLKGDAHLYWMEQMNMLQKHAEKIGSLNDIEKQRSNFEMLSTSIINSAKAFGINKKTFVLFCPMASENDGAFWLSQIATIENPYFGEDMLTCGSVEDTLVN